MGSCIKYTAALAAVACATYLGILLGQQHRRPSSVHGHGGHDAPHHGPPRPPRPSKRAVGDDDLDAAAAYGPRSIAVSLRWGAQSSSGIDFSEINAVRLRHVLNDELWWDQINALSLESSVRISKAWAQMKQRQ